ncbi:MAG: hypothetical protein MJ094_05660 [Saccharofermentans sp.]|nr:hypothetical protein [Saccharofermentans sp.]
MGKYDNVPAEYKPIGMWGYLGYEILFTLPGVGWIILIIFACGASGNENVKNFARSYFCLFIIQAVIVAILIVAMIAAEIDFWYFSQDFIDALNNFG